jgi:hypothetical protein
VEVAGSVVNEVKTKKVYFSVRSLKSASKNLLGLIDSATLKE